MSNTNTNTNTWDINSLKKERENIKRNIIKLNNVKQRKRLIALHNKSLASKKKGLRPRIMSNREIENHKKYIKKTLKDIKKTKKIDPITKKIKVLEANNLTNSRIRHSNTLYRFLRERPERVKPKRLLQNFKTVENKPRNLTQENKWEIDYLKREIFRYEGNISILDNKEKTAINAMKKRGASDANIKNRKEIFNRNKRKYRLKLNKAKKDLKNIMP
tara:strand:- start:24 stop:674 length:651 start_codon:yes stop_codon:yes gene_type:complete